MFESQVLTTKHHNINFHCVTSKAYWLFFQTFHPTPRDMKSLKSSFMILNLNLAVSILIK